MKNKIITLAILTGLITPALNSQEASRDRFSAPAEMVAEKMVNRFDLDETGALNKLELSAAIDAMMGEHPYLVNHLDFTTGFGDNSAPPRIAYNLVAGFDGNNDVQLTEQELSLAISYLRQLSRSANGLVAVAG